MLIRSASGSDAEHLSGLLADYLHEGYPGHIGSTPAELRRDVFTAAPLHHVVLAESDARAVGFLAWDAIYDMHWATSGGQVADLYVAPRARGHGIALALVARACADVQAMGGRFLRGGAYDRETTRRFYARVAVISPSGETHLSGRAFRRIAQHAGLPVRRLITGLPPAEWNFEP
jgi:GNAT superfamily N-acetyltransferase